MGEEFEWLEDVSIVCDRIVNIIMPASVDRLPGRFDTENLERSVLTLKHEADLLEKKIERAMQKASATGDHAPVDALEQELDEVRLAMKDCRGKAAGIKRCRASISDGTNKSTNSTNSGDTESDKSPQQASL